jgi:2-methylisocitrate lyase-like PEP mutase family enzyme
VGIALPAPMPWAYALSMTDRTRLFHQLHQSGCFVIPNPWDRGSARLLAKLGFRALATTSSGSAWSHGKQDGHLPLDHVLMHIKSIAEAVDVPVSADFEAGFAESPDDVSTNVTRATATGVAGLSIEDSTRNPSKPLFDFTLAVERVHAARRAIDATGTGILLTARSEGYIVGSPDLDETIRRLTAFANAGADCLFAPGLRSKSDISAIVRAVAPKPVNVLVGSDFTTAGELAELGVRRISVGGALARSAATALLDAAREIADLGTFTKLGRAVSFAELNGSVTR